jgi:hypothetical protein
VQELPQLRQPVQIGATNPFHGAISSLMWQACVNMSRPQEFITPMAAVAGAVAQHLLRHFELAAIDKAYINNGGDIAFHLAPGHSLKIGLIPNLEKALLQPMQLPEPQGYYKAEYAQPVRGIATSGWQGRSFSLGIADAVTVLAATASQADAAATLIANQVTIDHPGIVRKPADQLRDDTDLGQRLVTCAVPDLTSDEIDTALMRGLALAQNLLKKGLIAGALLTCQGRYLSCGYEDSLVLNEEGVGIL